MGQYFIAGAAISVACIVYFMHQMKMDEVRDAVSAAGGGRDDGKHDIEPLINGDNEPQQEAQVWTVVKKTFFPVGLAVMNTFMLTLMMFPGVSGLIESQPWGAGDATWTLPQSWFSVVLVGNFQVFDFVGRSLPEFRIWLKREELLGAALLRWIFAPVFVLLASGIVGPDIIGNSVAQLVMCLMALTNGYVSTLGMMFGPSYVAGHEKSTAGTVMSLYLLSSIALGLFSALPLGKMILAFKAEENSDEMDM